MHLRDAWTTQSLVLLFPDPETGAIIGAGIAVHRLMGRGFLEPVYRAALAIDRGLLLNFGTATLQTQRLVWGLEDDALQKRETTGENTERHNGPGDTARS